LPYALGLVAAWVIAFVSIEDAMIMKPKPHHLRIRLGGESVASCRPIVSANSQLSPT
jgi:hypothetical protein